MCTGIRVAPRKCVVSWDKFVAWCNERWLPVNLDNDDDDDERGQKLLEVEGLRSDRNELF